MTHLPLSQLGSGVVIVRLVKLPLLSSEVINKLIFRAHRNTPATSV